MALLLVGVAFGLFSGITGIQTIHAEPGRTWITYWQGYGRLLPVAYAGVLALVFYAIYRRYPFTWRLGFVFLYLSAADFVFQAWWSLWPQPYGWVGAAAVTAFAPFITLYWASWWRRQKPYFFPDGAEQT